MDQKKIGFAFAGPIAAGKTFNATKIGQILGCDIYSFGTPVKQFAKLLEDTFPELNPDGAVKNRKLLQTVGEGLKSVLHPTIWTEGMLKKIGDSDYAIIDDLRFDVEFKSLKADPIRKWYLIYLSIPQLTRVERVKKQYPKNWKDHLKNDICEIPIREFDHISLDIESTIKYVSAAVTKSR